jgi:hypothetical protein
MTNAWKLFALMGASMCWVAAEADTQFSIHPLRKRATSYLLSLKSVPKLF